MFGNVRYTYFMLEQRCGHDPMPLSKIPSLLHSTSSVASDGNGPTQPPRLCHRRDLKFMFGGVPSDPDEAIELYRAALRLLPPGRSNRFASLVNLATSLNRIFEKRSIPSDCDEAIDLN
ncbi:hypothetical protein BD769DRAFT_1778631 [Suillus cothurnatus]|nr:hypothetical protein BD769DRAFT_1778631 [Suillus cothurnatus]